ncbi:MAG: DUF1189 domain-containing protein [Phycisphaerae bacterium]|nr:DUF1189 domain-containing protein [Phycisphaerae bacterium]NIP55472.1 DUF1189 domain-containing protein [Phycisphaerae bacterium]NIS54177.1 DUF1189 domain-containing protein [Phycisphaerae bacterium]NIU11781.1 DUF1189 domain-containing protein [Phycisphaerae bacterium]NIU59604.1 DUF1189 domain-containing protein [Phycisphaerae bacterium]
MKKYSIIHLPVLSFYSKDLYRDVGLNWKGICFGYLLLFLAICWIPMMVKIHTGFSAFVQNDAPPVIDQVPEITITDGRVSIAEPQPYFIREPDSNQVIAVIDTTGNINSPSDANAFFLLTENMMITQTEFETRTIDLSQFDNLSISGDDIMGFLNSLRKYLVIILYPLALLSSYVYRIIQALIYAAIGLIFASTCKITLSYGALLRLAVAAMTPCMIIRTVFALAGVDFRFISMLYILIILAYLYFSVYSCSQKPPEEQVLQVPEQTQI